MITGLGHFVFVRNVGFEVRIPVVTRVFELEEFAGAIHALEKFIFGRNGQCDRLKLKAFDRNTARLKAFLERVRIIGDDAHVLVADVDDHRGKGCPRIRQQIFDLAGAQQRLDIDHTGTANADGMHAVGRLNAGSTVINRCSH